MSLHLSQYVRNFGTIAKVVGFHEVTGDPILQDFSGQKWLATSDLCDPCDAPAALRHKGGLAVFE